MDLPNPGIEPRSSTQASHIAGRFFTAEPKRLPAVRETRVLPLGWEDPLEKEMATSPVLLPRKFHGWRSLGYSPWGRKESDMTERLHFPFHFHLAEAEEDVLNVRRESVASDSPCRDWGVN